MMPLPWNFIMFHKIVIWKLYELDGQSVNEGICLRATKEQMINILNYVFFI